MAKPKRLIVVAETQGRISKNAAHSFGSSVLSMLGAMLNTDGTFKDENIQRKFEAWKASPEGMKYA